MIQNCSISVYEEGLIPQDEIPGIIGLLGECFEGYPDRSFYKQLPHRRWLVHDGDLVALVGADLRHMRLGDQGLRVTGIIDLCVRESHRSRGIAGTLVRSVEDFATAARSDAIILFADDQRLYRKLGFVSVQNPVRLLRLAENRSFDVVSRRYGDSLMIKSLSSVSWDSEAELDLLGYLY
ncbi:MAG: GNAT family N-acetyltransferase [Planctomycetes bacterium]|nr:GNAT family N-acetyltransferase [Planctomycetota bacterium]